MYQAATDRYDNMPYNRCGASGLKLPAISLGLWHNFGGVDVFENSRAMIRRAFDLGITHFDLANNYGPPPGSAEETFGMVLSKDLRAWRDELIISTKAGWDMWPGPYGDWGSRKYLIASLDQSLKRMGLDYVDIFYHHRFDPETPLEESMGALDSIVRSGKALYVGISNYSAEQTEEAVRILRSMGTPFIINQFTYNMFSREAEEGLLSTLEMEKIGGIVYCPLAQGLLTNKYLNHQIPEGSRASKEHGFLKREQITEEVLMKIQKLNELAVSRQQSLAQLALQWVLRQQSVTSVLVGASKVSQIEDCVRALSSTELSVEDEIQIERILEV